ncbi:major allergen Pru ar 1-like [Syzygium oleosum]|uniref:major allergen Pru ar 1-like n=1 Tax=Syzygium oleosum TaxID=219896 RepID=UPI0011D2B16F|nr:major allergen Pru ar 1-like [Syzygium oleosum]
MGLVTYKTEITFSIPPAKVVEALVEAGNLLPKDLLPVIKSAAVLEEETSSEGSQYKTVEQKVDAPDKENFIYSCSIVEGDELANTYENMSHEVKITASPEGGSVCKNMSVYYTVGEVDNKEEKIKAGKEKACAMVKAIEAYLVANPHD